VVGGSVSSSQPQGRVVGTEPAGEAPRGATIVIQTSSGNGNPPAAAGPPPANPVAAPPVAPVSRTRTDFPKKKRLPKCRPNGPRPCRVVHSR
jgi:beta-lactam-binding protein with PASTA domain